MNGCDRGSEVWRVGSRHLSGMSAGPVSRFRRLRGRKSDRVGRAGRGVLVLAMILAAGCELDEVAAPPSEDLLVVEAVLRAGANRQYILLHHSLLGGTIRGEPGATISVTPEGGAPVLFEAAGQGDCFVPGSDGWMSEELTMSASCYWSPASAGRFVVPGMRYDLQVVTADGQELRGRTTVPGRFELRSPRTAVDSATFSRTCLLPGDPFTLTWNRSEGAWAYLSSLRLQTWGDSLRKEGIAVPDPLDLTGLSVSAADTSQAFPSNLGLFERFSLDQRLLIYLQSGLPRDADATLVVLALDRNYTNAIRGGRFNPSGLVRISSVTGDGIGVFGSVVPIRIHSPNAVTSALGRVPECGAVAPLE